VVFSSQIKSKDGHIFVKDTTLRSVVVGRVFLMAGADLLDTPTGTFSMNPQGLRTFDVYGIKFIMNR